MWNQWLYKVLILHNQVDRLEAANQTQGHLSVSVHSGYFMSSQKYLLFINPTNTMPKKASTLILV